MADINIIAFRRAVKSAQGPEIYESKPLQRKESGVITGCVFF